MARRGLLIMGLIIEFVLVMQSIGWALPPEGGQPQQGHPLQVTPQPATPPGTDGFNVGIVLLSIGAMLIASAFEYQHRKRNALEAERAGHERQLAESAVMSALYSGLDSPTGSGLLIGGVYAEIKEGFSELRALKEGLQQKLSGIDDQETELMKAALDEHDGLLKELQEKAAQLNQAQDALWGRLAQLESTLIGRIK